MTLEKNASHDLLFVLLDSLCHNKHTMGMSTKEANKPVVWLGNSLDELRKFPDEVQDEMGYALYQAQINKKHPSAKPLKGFKGAGVLEIVENFDGDTYRTVYTVKLAGVVYVLHAFQKKSKKGIATPTKDIELIKKRLKLAIETHKANQK